MRETAPRGPRRGWHDRLVRGGTLWKRREAIFLPVLLVAGIVYAIVHGGSVPPSAGAQEPVAVACLKRAGFNVKSDSYSDDFRSELVEDADGAGVAVIYLAEPTADSESLAGQLKDSQKTYGDYKDETIEQRGSAVIRLGPSFDRAGAIHTCVDQAEKAKDT